MAIEVKHPILPRVKPVHFKLDLPSDRKWIVWWYCGLRKNRSDLTQPLAQIAFRELTGQTLSDHSILRKIPITTMGQFRVGSIWQDDRCRFQINFHSEKFSLNFSRGGWRITSFYEARKNGTLAPFPQDIYPLGYDDDRNYLIEFSLPSGGRLLVPCLEYLSRCYGRSQELVRILTTYGWEDAKKRLYAQISTNPPPGIWELMLGKRLVNDDAVFLAHALYDRFTQFAAKRIAGQILVNYENGSDSSIFVKVQPWFEGDAELLVSGIWFDNNRSFLALGVIGATEPGGNTINCDRANTNKVDAPAAEGESGAWTGATERILNKRHEIVDLTNYDDPDRQGETIELMDDAFVILGDRRTVINVHRAKAKDSAGPKIPVTDADSFSGGEPHGNGKSVGKAFIHASQIMETHGVLDDMWKALLYLKAKNPTIIQKVEWFTFQDQFQSMEPVKLVTLEASADEDNMTTADRVFQYYDVKGKILRGVLVIRITTPTKPVFIVEIQRKPKTKKTKSGEKVDAEEAFRGIVFILDNQDDFEQWITTLLNHMKTARGVVKKIIGYCPGVVDTFKHSQSAANEIPCQSTAIDALSKVGITVK